MFSLQSVLQFLREIYFQGVVLELGLSAIYTYHLSTIFHTYAHLDLIVRLNSLWIHYLTLQYMNCKYALFIFSPVL
jgi:hypothetical protein